MRQWVLSLPYELRGLAATKPDVLTALGRIFAEEVERMTKRLAGVAGTETGAVSFPQRFGGSLNFLGRYEDAIRDYERAIAVDPSSAVVHANLGEAEQCLGRHARAIEAFGRALAHDPQSKDALYGRGVSRAALGELREAVADLDAVIASHDPKSARGSGNRESRAVI